jgi:hypothetical protein
VKLPAAPARRRVIASLVVAVAVALSLFAQPGAAKAHDSEQLLRTYAPALVMHAREQLRPVRVDGFLADSSLSGNHYDTRACSPVGGPGALACYVELDASHGSPPVVYGASFRSGARTVLEYWIFYSFDLLQVASPSGELWQDHEGDWEAVAVVLGATGKPLYVGTSRHCGGARRDWARVAKRGRHPMIFVALGSHANYFGPGEPRLDRRCLPATALSVVDAYGARLRDHVVTGPAVTLQVVPVTATSPSWMTFSGAWGETQYLHVPNNPAFAYGLGPRGPAFHALWRKPIATLLGWPAG